MTSLRPFVSLLSALFLFACTASEPGSAIVEVDSSDVGKADAFPIVVAYDDFTLTIEPRLERRIAEDGTSVLVLSGKTNRHVAEGSAVVRSRVAPEAQPIGTYRQLSVQRFELELSESEALSLFEGADVFFVWDMVREDLGIYAARVTLAATISVQESWSFNPQSILDPVVADGRTKLRLEGRTQDRWYGFGLVLGDDMLAPARIGEDERAFRFDLPPELLLPMIGTDRRYEVTLDGATGHFSAGVRRVEMRHSDRGADAFYISANSCWNGTRQCLTDELAEGTLDLSKCGTPMEVLPCAAEVGVRVTEAEVADATESAVVAREEAAALVGEGRADAFVDGAGAMVRAALAKRLGAWYLDEAAVRASLATEARRAADRAVAYPFEVVEQAPLMGTTDPETAKTVAADAFLAYLPTYDFVHSEFQSSYLDIVRGSRDEHLAVFRAIYRGVTDEEGEPYIEVGLDEAPFSFNFNWLGAYIELSVPAVGEPHVYLEID